jgi:hypothetical protein
MPINTEIICITNHAHHEHLGSYTSRASRKSHILVLHEHGVWSYFFLVEFTKTLCSNHFARAYRLPTSKHVFIRSETLYCHFLWSAVPYHAIRRVALIRSRCDWSGATTLLGVVERQEAEQDGGLHVERSSAKAEFPNRSPRRPAHTEAYGCICMSRRCGGSRCVNSSTSKRLPTCMRKRTT